MIRLAHCFWWISLGILTAAEETGLPLQRVFLQKEYKGGPQIWASAQDHRGVMYFGNYSSVLEYDGAAWRRIPVPSLVARSLSADAEGRIWVGCSANIGYLAPDEKGSLQYVSLLERIPAEHRGFADIWATFATPQGVFFQAATKMFRWDGKQMRVWSPKTRFVGMAQLEGRIFVNQTGVGLQEIAGDDLRNLPGGEFFKDFGGIYLGRYDKTRMWIASGGRVSLYDGTGTVPFPTEVDEAIKATGIYRAAALPGNRLCLTSLRGGAVILDRQGKLLRRMNTDTGLPANNVLSAFPDRDGALWLGTALGIAKVEIQTPIGVFWNRPLSGAVRYEGSIYIATNQGGSTYKLARDPKTGIWQPELLKGAANQQSFALTVFDDGKKKQLLMGSTAGILRVKGGAVIPLGTPTGSSSYVIQQSRKTPNRVYTAASGMGSIRWDQGRWIDEGLAPGVTREIFTFTEAEDGAIWASYGSVGLVRLEVPATGMRDAKVKYYNESNGLPKGTLRVFGAGGLVFSHGVDGSSIFRLDPATDRFVKDNRFLLPLKDAVPDGDPAEVSVFVAELNNGDLWSASWTPQQSRRGMFRRQPDGSYRLEEPAVFQHWARDLAILPFVEPDGQMWFPTDDGLARFDLSVPLPPLRPFSVLVRGVNAGPKDVIYGGYAEARQLPPQLAYGRNSLQFTFAAPVYKGDEDILYRFRLEGADKAWSAWGLRKEANYSSLGPGDYRFRAQARTVDGRIGEEGVYVFRILPPWYRTWWAYLGYVALFGLLAVGAGRGIARHEREKSRKETERLESLVTARTAEISERAAELATVNRITQALSSQLDPAALIALVGDQIREVFQARAASVAILDRGTGKLSFAYGEADPMARRILQSGQASLETGQHLGVPILAGGELAGVLTVQADRPFTEADQRLLSTIASAVGVAFHNARLFEEARLARVAAEEAGEAKSNFLSNVSHELRTPLTSVLGFAKIIRKRLDEVIFPLVGEEDKKVLRTKQQVSTNLDVIVSEGERLTKLINDVLDLAKIQAGKISWNMGPVSVAEVIEKALAATSSLFEAKKLELIRELASELPEIHGDGDRLIQVVINLISNAVKFTDAGSVTCSARLVDGEIVVSVKDSGIGIKPEDQPTVFEKFKQVGDTLTDKPQGTGLGLPISKEIVEYHGGRMWVESAIGSGSTFFFTLPVEKI
jgi:signal transduction histidine kinase